MRSIQPSYLGTLMPATEQQNVWQPTTSPDINKLNILQMNGFGPLSELRPANPNMLQASPAFTNRSYLSKISYVRCFGNFLIKLLLRCCEVLKEAAATGKLSLTISGQERGGGGVLKGTSQHIHGRICPWRLLRPQPCLAQEPLPLQKQSPPTQVHIEQKDLLS